MAEESKQLVKKDVGQQVIDRVSALCEAGFTMPFYIPQDKNLYYKFATKTIPRTYIVNAGGKVVAAYSDAPIADLNSIEHHLQQLLAKGGN